MTEHVYVAYCPLRSSVKVGASRCVYGRMDVLSKEAGSPVILFRDFDPYPYAPRTIESSAHAILSEKRIASEWFQVDPQTASAAVQNAMLLCDEVASEHFFYMRFADRAFIVHALEEIEYFCARHGIAESVIGTDCVNDPRWVERLRSGEAVQTFHLQKALGYLTMRRRQIRIARSFVAARRMASRDDRHRSSASGPYLDRMDDLRKWMANYRAEKR